MKKLCRVELLLFGPLRKYSPNGKVTLHLPLDSSLSTLKKEVALWIKNHNPSFDNSLLEASAIATQTEVLKSDFVIQEDCELAILPPVCGG